MPRKSPDWPSLSSATVCSNPGVMADQHERAAVAVFVRHLHQGAGGGVVDARVAALFQVAQAQQHLLERLQGTGRGRAQDAVGDMAMGLEPTARGLGFGHALARQRSVAVVLARRGGLGVGMAQQDDLAHYRDFLSHLSNGAQSS